MAKTEKKSKRKKATPSKIKTFIQSTRAFFADRRVQFVFGALIVAFAVFFCFSYVSFFSAGLKLLENKNIPTGIRKLMILWEKIFGKAV